MNFWETKEWTEAKSAQFTTDKILTRVEYLKQVGAGSYSDESYQKYLKAMSEKPKEIEDEKSNLL